MPNTRVIKTKPVETKPTTLKTKARTGEVSYHRSKRASSCPRCYHGNVRDPVAVETRGRAPKETTKARAAATGELKATEKTRAAAAACELKTTANSRTAACAASQLQAPSTHSKTHYETHSHKAFTVFAPNPKKRQDIQKTEAELAALEDLRLSQAMGYVSISPSAVGGCLTLEEVRIKQQQEMQIKRRQKQMKKSALGTSSMVFG
ncbi:uncharacterized protein [Salminus brasiliensis]|uniref:uncharacterized protein isoform X2 n=1 Tax=Salminus brasiliensis TaxID=930266 RepID=UPI003B835B42